MNDDYLKRLKEWKSTNQYQFNKVQDEGLLMIKVKKDRRIFKDDRDYLEELKLTLGEKFDSIEFGELLGNLYGDGGIYYGKLFYGNTELNLVERFVNNVKFLFGKDIKIYPRKICRFSKRYKDFFGCNYYCVPIVNGIDKIDINKLTHNQKIGFIRCFFDDEGSVSKDGIITISQKDKSVLITLSSFMFELGIKTKLCKLYNKVYGQTYYYLIMSKGYNKVFYDIISTIHKGKQERLKNNLGFTLLPKKVMKVWKNKWNNQKLVTIPKDSDIKEGDYVKIIKI